MLLRAKNPEAVWEVRCRLIAAWSKQFGRLTVTYLGLVVWKALLEMRRRLAAACLLLGVNSLEDLLLLRAKSQQGLLETSYRLVVTWG